jgi:hypothetical protein
MDKRTREAIRYMGCKSDVIEEKTLQIIKDTFCEIEKISAKGFAYGVYEIQELNHETVQFANVRIYSRHLCHNLRNCDNVIVFGATLGLDIDRQMQKYEKVDVAKAFVLQACAASYIEEYCDEVEKQIAKCEGLDITQFCNRFSPGYGDFSLHHQEEILSLIDATKKVGIYLTDGCMLVPTKSVTALIGIKRTKEE